MSDQLVYWAQKLEFHIRNFCLLKPADQRTFLREKWKVFQERRQVWMGRVNLGFKASQASPHRSYQARLAQLWQTNDDAADAYRPEPYPGRITHFRAAKDYRLFEDPNVGWEPLAKGGVDRQILTAYPAGTLVEPFVTQAAARLHSNASIALFLPPFWVLTARLKRHRDASGHW